MDELKNVSKDTIMHAYFTALLEMALHFNASIVQYSAIVIAAGPQKQASYKRIIKEFEKLHSDYRKKSDEVIAKANEQFEGVKKS